MNILLAFAVICVAFFGMELVAWAAHKFVMHGFLWTLHKDHHVKQPGFFEKNDAFFLIFAIPSWLCIMLGVIYNSPVSVLTGVGILIYGIAYFLVHEVLIHRRFKWFNNTKNIYFLAILRAHKMHHKKLDKDGGESFGMLIIHPKYIKQELELRQKHKLQQQ